MRCKECDKKDKVIRDLRISIRCGRERERRLVDEKWRLKSQIEEMRKRP